MTLQQNIRTRNSITQLELEYIKDLIDQADLSSMELTMLKDLAKARAGDSARTLGWHCGFEDLAIYLIELLSLKKAA